MKYVNGFFTALVVTVLAVSPAYAAPVGGTIVKGKVQKPNNKNIGVDVTCTHSGTPTTLHTTTDPNNAKYEVTFTLAQCSDGDSVSVHAANGANGSGVVHDKNPRKQIEINVGKINASVPEFGTVTGLVALTASAGGFLMMRKKYATVNA